MGKDRIPNHGPQICRNAGTSDNGPEYKIESPTHLKETGKYMGGLHLLRQVFDGMIEKMPPVVCKFLEIFVDLILMGIDDAFFESLGIVIIKQKKNRVLVKLKLSAADHYPLFQLPKSASLSEVTIYVGEREIHGEVLEKQKARQIYEDEKSRGNESGLAEKNEFYTFEFKVYPVAAHDETKIRFLYYQPLKIDTGVGRYLYPLEDGGTDDAGMSFWTTNSKVEKTFSMNLELKSFQG